MGEDRRHAAESTPHLCVIGGHARGTERELKDEGRRPVQRHASARATVAARAHRRASGMAHGLRSAEPVRKMAEPFEVSLWKDVAGARARVGVARVDGRPWLSLY